MSEPSMRKVEEIKKRTEKKKQLYAEYAESDNAELRMAGPQFMEHAEDELRAALTAEISLDQLEAHCAAISEGRAVVLPCKVGDMVYVLGYHSHTAPITRATVRTIAIGSAGVIIDLVSHAQDGPVVGKAVDPSDFGKTVFLSRAEAEAAPGKG